MRIPRAVVGVVSWLVVVAVGSTLVWSVISRAGEGLVAEEPLPGATPSPPSASVGTDVPATVPASPTAPSASPSSAPSSAPPAPPPARLATWRGVGGEVVAQCEEGTVTLVSATPDPGFRAEVSGSGTRELEVELEGREEQDGSKAKVRAACVRGVPQFTSEVKTEDADSD